MAINCTVPPPLRIVDVMPLPVIVTLPFTASVLLRVMLVLPPEEKTVESNVIALASDPSAFAAVMASSSVQVWLLPVVQLDALPLVGALVLFTTNAVCGAVMVMLTVAAEDVPPKLVAV
jgi:hypothetical protein